MHFKLELVRVNNLLAAVLADRGRLGGLDRETVGLDRSTSSGGICPLVLLVSSILFADRHF
jgi:hypothetical protein